MVTVPADIPVKTPVLESIIAILVALLCQTPEGSVLDKVMVAETQTELGPVIGGNGAVIFLIRLLL